MEKGILKGSDKTSSQKRTAESTILEKWEFALQSGLFSDFVFTVGKNQERVECHTLVLRLQSPAFEEKFAENNSIQMIQLPNYEPASFRLFLKFLYTEDIRELSVIQALQMLTISIAFQTQRLTDLCKKFLISNIDVENCTEIFRVATAFNEEELDKFSESFILSNADAVFETKGFLKITLNGLRKIVGSSERKAKELSAYKAMLKWGQHQLRREHLELTPENLVKVLGPAIDAINYELLTLQEFSEFVAETKLLSQERVIEIYKTLVNDESERKRVAETVKQKSKMYINSVPSKTWKICTPISFENVKTSNSQEGLITGCTRFKVDRCIIISGVEILDGENEFVNTYASVTIYEGPRNNVLLRMERKYTSITSGHNNSNILSLGFVQPVRIEPATWITMRTLIQGPQRWQLSQCGNESLYKLGLISERVNFTFKEDVGKFRDCGVGRAQISFTVV